MNSVLNRTPIFFVYILKSNIDNNYYTGMTSRNLKERIKEHNGNKSSTPSTKNRNEFVLVYYEAHKNRQEARRREKFWKGGYGREIRDRLFAIQHH